MYKSIIFTITVATLSSVAYCQDRNCTVLELELCTELCVKSKTRHYFTHCGNINEIGPSSSICVGRGPKDNGYCGDEFGAECSIFYEKVPKAVCRCLYGSMDGCVVYEEINNLILDDNITN